MRLRIWLSHILLLQVVTCTLIAHCHAAEPETTNQQVLLAGASVADITPPLGQLVVGGFAPVPAVAVHDRMYARCVVLDNGKSRIAIVICDNLGINGDIYDEAREQLAKDNKIPVDNILMAATHTHSGTRAQADRYRPVVVQGIVEAVRGALKNLEPAQIGWGSSDEPSEVFNRRWYVTTPELRRNPFGGIDQVRMNPPSGNAALIKPAGPVDPEISVVSIQALNGRPLALLANYSLHYVGGVNKGDISADYFGVFAGRIAALLDAEAGTPPFVAMLSNGTSGDVNNINFRQRGPRLEPYEKMKRVAEKVAGRVQQVLEEIEYRKWVPLGSARREISLRTRKPDEKMQKYFEQLLAQPEETPAFHRYERQYASRVQQLLEGPDEINIPLQVVRIGGLGVAAIPFEVFTEIGLKIKADTPFDKAFTIELANDYRGYLPTPRQHELGGYETWMGTNKVEFDASEKITDVILELMQELHHQE